MIITTARKPSPLIIDTAITTAINYGLEYVPRDNKDLHSLINSSGPVLVYKQNGLSCFTEAGELFFHPNMAAMRIRNLREGEDDKMLNVCELEQGGSFLDCTAGLCSDSLVAQYRVGEGGRVLALERSLPVYLVMSHGLKNTKMPVFQKLGAKIELVYGDFRTILPNLPAHTFDTVYFDPMFDVPVYAASSLLPLRPLAVNQPITPDDIAMAARIAKNFVVLKERSFFDFAKLGMKRATDRKRKIAYGVFAVKENGNG